VPQVDKHDRGGEPGDRPPPTGAGEEP
jgi:hypothetical protein